MKINDHRNFALKHLNKCAAEISVKDVEAIHDNAEEHLKKSK